MNYTDFDKLVFSFFYETDIRRNTPNYLVKTFTRKADSAFVKELPPSLVDNLDMEIDIPVKKSHHVFRFSKSPFLELDSEGYIVFEILEANKRKKLNNIMWSFKFKNENEANRFFDGEVYEFTKFANLSELDKQNKEKLYLQFVSKDKSSGVKSIIISKSKRSIVDGESNEISIYFN